MKKGYLVTAFVLLVVAALAQKKEPCYAGVYINKADFLANRLSYKINESIKGEKLQFAFPADLTFTLKVVSPDSSITFKPGSIFGYYECGKIFRYSPGTESDGQEDFYEVEESKELVIYSSIFISGKESFYSLTPTSPIHRLTMKNLEVDFKDYTDFMNAMKKLKFNVDNGLASKDKDGSFEINKIYREIIGKPK